MFSSLSKDLRQEYPDEDVENALDTTVQAMFMTDSAATQGHASDFRLGGLRPKYWASNDSRYNILYLFHHVARLNAHVGGLAYDNPFDSNIETPIAQ